VVLAFGLAPSALAAVAVPVVDPDRQSPAVVSVQFIAPPGTDMAGLPELLAQPVGEPLSSTLVRRSVQLLYETGRFSIVRAYERPTPGGVTLLFELVPKVRVAEVVFRGNRVLAESELRRLYGIASGDELMQQRVAFADASLQKGYAHRGYPDAKLQTRVTINGTKATIAIDIDEGTPLRLRRVELTGLTGLPRWRVEERLALSPGMVADRDQLDAAMKRLARLYRDNAYYGADPPAYSLTSAGGDLVDIQVKIEAGKPFKIRFEGNITFSDRDLQRALDYDGEETLDDQLAVRLADRLREFYVKEGFLEAKVAAVLRPRGGFMVLSFRIDQGWLLTVSHIALNGVHSLDYAALLGTFEGEVRQEEPEPFFDLPDSAEVDALGVSGRPQTPKRPRYRADPNLFIPAAFARAIQILAEQYREQGFLSVETYGPVLDIDDRRHQVSVQVDVVEGPQTLVARTDVEGMPPKAAQGVSLIPVGQPLSRTRVDTDRKALLKRLDQEGFPFAKVEVVERLSEDHRAASVVFQVTEGPQVRLGQVVIQGARRTQPWLISGNLALHAGEAYRPDEFRETQKNLTSLGIFDSVQVGFLDPNQAEPVKDVLVQVHERKPMNIVFGGGYSLVEGPRAYVEYTDWNLFGLGLRFQTELRINYYPWSYLALTEPSGPLVLQGLPPATALNGKDNFYGFGGRLNATLTYPRAFTLFGGEGTLRLEGLVQRVDRPYYAFSQAAIIPGAALRLGKSWTLGMQYALEWDQITTYWANIDEIYSRLSAADLVTLRFPPGQGVIGGLGPSVSYDRRDNPVNPRAGWAATVKGKWVYGVFNPSSSGSGEPVFGAPPTTSAPLPVNLISLSATVAAYIPLGPTVDLALSVKGGRIFPLGNTFVIPTQRFFLGGADTDRGFQLDTMLPQDVRSFLDAPPPVGAIPVCRQTATGASCSTAARLVRDGNQLPSPGGQVFEALRAELRFPIYRAALNGAIFLDAGNLWSNPIFFNAFVLRPAAGGGVRLPSPIGQVAFDVGFNLNPDYLVNESLVQFFLTIGVF
jgi:outer membrane protein insertion porin family